MFQLPFGSRFITAINPSKDWDWDKETRSRILSKLDMILCTLANMFREKGKPKVNPEGQYQPEYVKEAKKEWAEKKEEEKRFTEEQMEAVKRFWKSRNPKAKFMEE